MKKIKVFLGAYINSTNAQNLSCLTLAEHLDKSVFEVYALEIYNGNLKRVNIPGVTTFYCFNPFRLSGLIGFYWGIRKCDIAFMPRGNMFRYNKLLLRTLNKRCFKTIENVLDDTVLPSILAVYGSLKGMKEGYGMCDRLYSISCFMKKYNEERFGIKSEPRILRLATDTKKFLNVNKKPAALKEVVFIGNDMLRKGIFDFLFLAGRFPDIKFNIVGSGQGKIDIQGEVYTRKLNNIRYYKVLKHDELINLLTHCDLHILPSRSEGFPKVILETAAAGIPSILYNDYGANEWIKNWYNGIVVNSITGMEDALQTILEDSNLLRELSFGAIELSKEFSIHKIVKDYEEVIKELYQAK